jgi:hypothetical protein
MNMEQLVVAVVGETCDGSVVCGSEPFVLSYRQIDRLKK